MKLKEINEKEFEKFARKHPLYTFHQTKEWAHLKEKNGWMNVYLGLFDKEKILGVSLLLYKDTPLKKKMYYAPRGFLLDYHDDKVLNKFTKELYKYMKQHKAIFVKIDPTIIYQARNIDGDIIDGMDNENKLIEKLKKLGYKHHGLNIDNRSELQPRWVFVLPIENKNSDEIYEKFNSRTKRSIKKCQNHAVEVEQMKKEDLKIFKEIMEHTSTRRGFLDRPFSYYQSMIETLKDKCKIFIAYLNVTRALEMQHEIIKQEDLKIKQFEKTIESKKSQQGIENSKKIIESSKIEIEKLSLLKQEKGDKIPLAGAMFLHVETEMTYLFGGSYKEYMNYPSQYLIQWTAICEAIKKKCNLYNFYGIDGNLKENGEMHGVYEFKRGFDGEVREYIGEFDLVISKLYYFIYNFAFKVYRQCKHFLTKLRK